MCLINMSNQRIFSPVVEDENISKTIFHNLPANRFGNCLRRQTLERNILEGINSSDSIILVYGQGGRGKSASVYHILTDIINYKIRLDKQIDKIFWFSDADNPGTLNHIRVINDIKFTCGISVSSKVYNSSVEEELKEVSKVFDSTKLSIIVLDNFETIVDKKLLDYFLYSTPMGCKIVLVSKYNADYYRNQKVINERLVIKEIKAKRFSPDEWNQAFKTRCENNESLQKWSKSMSDIQLKEALKSICTKLDGNIFGMISVVSIFATKGIVEYNEINEELNEASVLESSFEQILSHSWNLLSKNAQSILVASTLQGTSYLNFNFIEKISGIQKARGDRPKTASDLDSAVTECINLNLIESEIIDGQQRYYISSFVYCFMLFKLMNESHNTDENDIINFKGIIDKWIEYYKELAKDIGFCYDNTQKMQIFDNPDNRSSLMFVLEYCYKNKRYDDFILISENMRYFFYTRAIWNVGDSCIHIKRAIAAQKINDFICEFESLIYYLNIAFKYRLLDRIEPYLKRVEEIRSQYNISNEHYAENYFRYKHMLGLYYYAKENYERALEQWDDILNDDLISGNTHYVGDKLHIHDVDAALRWRLKCYLKQENVSSGEIIMLCKKYLKTAKYHNFERGIIDYSLMIVNEYIKLEQIGKALEQLEMIDNHIKTVNDLLYTIRYYLYLAFCYGDTKIGRGYLIMAKDIRKDNISDSSIKKIIEAMREKNMFCDLLNIFYNDSEKDD